MTEQVIRHRGASRDEDGKYIPGSDTPLQAFGIAPGGGARQSQRAREGVTIEHTVYFWPVGSVDLKTDDELTVRGDRYQIIVNDWQMQGMGGLEVLCTRGKG